MTTTDTRWREFDVKDCPPSAVADQLVQWFEVAEGDLVLHGGQLCQLVQMWPTGLRLGPDIGIRLLREGQERDTSVDSNAWTCVRRYDLTAPDRLLAWMKRADEEEK